MYMIREVWYCKRGKAPEIAEDMKKANQLFVSQGNTTGRILVDVSGRMDTVVFQFEVESLDRFFARFHEPEPYPGIDLTQLADHLHDNTVQGTVEIYEVVL